MATDGLYAMCRCAYRLSPCSYDVLKVSAIFLSQNRVPMHIKYNYKPYMHAASRGQCCQSDRLHSSDSAERLGGPRNTLHRGELNPVRSRAWFLYSRRARVCSGPGPQHTGLRPTPAIQTCSACARQRGRHCVASGVNVRQHTAHRSPLTGERQGHTQNQRPRPSSGWLQRSQTCAS